MRRFVLGAATLLVTLAVILGCSHNPEAPPPPTNNPGTIRISPANANVLITGTLDLAATLSNVSDTTVTWHLLHEPGVSDTVDIGTIVPTGGRTARFTAPPTVDTPGFDLTITVQAVDVSDTTVTGSAVIVVPRVSVGVIPNSVTSVPPGTQVPFRVTVQNATDQSFSLTVNGIPGGDQGVGTWIQTGATSTIYTAPSRDTLFLYGLLARSNADPLNFALAHAGVRPGFAIPTTDPSRSEYSPEWDPTGPRVAFVRGGPPWDVVVYNFDSQIEQVLTTFSWGGPVYTGRISWSEDGTQLAFSEESGGVRTIGLVHADGSARTSFGPDPSTNYDEACFFTVSSPAVESLYVAQDLAGVSTLRAYPLAAAAGDPGRILHQASPGATIHWPDAVQLPLQSRPSVAFGEGNGITSGILITNDNGRQLVSNVVGGLLTLYFQPRWVIPTDGVPWITYVDNATSNIFRAQRTGSVVQRCYTDFFPEQSGDLKANPPVGLSFVDAHVVARLEPDGHTRLWVIGFPPSSVTPVSQALEIELKRAGLWQAFSPSAWRRWRSGARSL